MSAMKLACSLRLCALALAFALPVRAHAQQPIAEETVVRWNARVMPGYELEREHPSDRQPGEDTDRYGVFLDQARLQLELERGMLDAELSADLADALRPELIPSSPPYLRDAWLGARFTKALRLRAGHFKRPFSKLELTSSGVLPIRGRGLTNSLIVEDAGFGDRALGLMLWGKLPGDFSYRAELSNPDWTDDASTETRGAAANARIEWEPVPELSLGADYAYRLRVVDGEKLGSHAGGIDARLQTGALVVLFDARVGQLRETASSASPLGYGLVAYGSYDVALDSELALQPVLLAEYVDADTDFARDEAIRGVVGLNLILADGLRIMPQAELVRSVRAADGQSPWTNSERYYVLLSAQL